MPITRPPTGAGFVEGDENDNRIDVAYTGDPEGDMIDNGDAIDPSAGPDDDIVDAKGGDDYVEAGEGDDVVYAGSGDDEVYGQSGDDILYGDANAPGTSGGRQVFQWDLAPDPDDGGDIDAYDDLSGGFTQNTGSVDVTFTVVSQSPASASTFSAETQLVDGITTDGAPADSTSALDSDAYVQGDPVVYDLDFSAPVENVSFRINDIDNDGVVTVKAFDANGDPVEVTLTGGSRVTLSDTDAVAGDDTATSVGGNMPYTSTTHSVLVEIAGPISSLEIVHDQDGPADSGIAVTDIYFDAPDADPGADGDDQLHGGEGDDIIYGEGGRDTITGGDGNDTVYGGDGDDTIDTSSTSGVPLPDRGFPSYQGLPEVPADSDPYDDRDTVDGGAGNDTIITGDDNDVIYGGAGNDTIDGGLDDDQIDGGSGDDFIVGGEGADTIDGGEGNDTIYGGLDPSFPDVPNIPDDGSAGDPDPETTNGMDVIHGGAGDDTIYGQDDDDTIYGDDGNDVIDGGIDDDYIDGGAGNDTLIGGQGVDTVFGGDGRDDFRGSYEGGDSVDGGSGGDDFDTLYMGGQRYVITSETDDADGNSTSGTMDLLDSTGSVTGSMTFKEIEKIVPCFTPGTRIATPQGERPVEDLEVGDRVITRDNGIQEIRWIGKRRLNGLELSLADHLQPVMIRKGALGKGLPERDMMVSPQHRVLIANDRTALYFEEREVLVAAKHLIGTDGIERVDLSSVTYIHFMFDQHEVVLSDGAWTESFQPGDLTLEGMDSAQRAELLDLFPELTSEQGFRGYQSARRSLKRHEAALLMQ
ncbi:Hint domain-containing protein [Antarcticimicrobium luteum]|uniref:Type I secretion protein n=1 Tax=Antarcticimicrobium luteum TaxID=2547397 RepID=A0A4R5V6A5_9RHOB|nr:Hint domain-containing protein [Antarcticimicrobium luteum]TDK47424.1 type I secretion protein [Antarcticimicrobium luteum]